MSRLSYEVWEKYCALAWKLVRAPNLLVATTGDALFTREESRYLYLSWENGQVTLQILHAGTETYIYDLEALLRFDEALQMDACTELGLELLLL